MCEIELIHEVLDSRVNKSREYRENNFAREQLPLYRNFPFKDGQSDQIFLSVSLIAYN